MISFFSIQTHPGEWKKESTPQKMYMFIYVNGRDWKRKRCNNSWKLLINIFIENLYSNYTGFIHKEIPLKKMNKYKFFKVYTLFNKGS